MEEMNHSSTTKHAAWFCLLEVVWVGSALLAIGIRPHVFHLYENVGPFPYSVKWWWLLLPWAIALIAGADYLRSRFTHLPAQGRASWYYLALTLLAVLYLLLSFLPLNITITSR